jgi:regulator of sigma E protease
VDFSAMSAVLQRSAVVFLVISAVIFVHELGHFLAARWAGVLVERFSIGLGPVLLSRRWGDTEYVLSAIPLGGYVKMLGQTDTPEVEEVNTDPRSYQSKSVGWRMVIISAGVVMNIIFGFALFASAYALGVPYTPGVIGSAFPGMPAWKAGVQEGDRLVAVNGTLRDDFEDIRRSVMLANPKKDSINFTMARRLPDGSPRQVDFYIQPFKDGTNLLPQVGVTPASSLRLVRWSDEDGISRSNSPVGRASGPGFQGADQILAIDDKEVADYHTFNRLMYQKRRDPVTVTVRRDADHKTDGEQVQVKLEPNFIRTFGLVMQIGKIEGVRPDSPAAKAVNAETGEPLSIQEGDQIKKINDKEDFDPMRLPDLVSDDIGKPVILEIVREGRLTQTYKVKVVPELVPPWNDYGEASVFAGKESFPVSIPSIGIAYQVGRTVRKVLPDGPAAKATPKIEPGDVIMGAEFTTDLIKKSETVSLEVANNWPQVFWNLQSGRVGKQFTFTLQRNDAAGQPVKVKIEPTYDETWPFHQRGFELVTDQSIRQESTVGGAMSRGMQRTKSAIIELYLILKQLVVGNMSLKSFSGPIQIGAITYQLTNERAGLLLWFVAFLSINLAIFNFLPIPILDGGHMAFLLYEMIFRKQATGKAVAVLNHLGFFFLIGLMLYVFSLDILRLVGVVRM